MIVEEFEPDVFRQLIEYIHTGCVTLQVGFVALQQGEFMGALGSVIRQIL